MRILAIETSCDETAAAVVTAAAEAAQPWAIASSVVASQVELPAAGKDDVARIQELWQECRSQYASRGPWLFGEYSIADAMYAPVALRFRHYGAKLADATVEAYFQQLIQDPHLQRWIKDAEEEVASGFGAGR